MLRNNTASCTASTSAEGWWAATSRASCLVMLEEEVQVHLHTWACLPRAFCASEM